MVDVEMLANRVMAVPYIQDDLDIQRGNITQDHSRRRNLPYNDIVAVLAAFARQVVRIAFKKPVPKPNFENSEWKQKFIGDMAIGPNLYGEYAEGKTEFQLLMLRAIDELRQKFPGAIRCTRSDLEFSLIRLAHKAFYASHVLYHDLDLKLFEKTDEQRAEYRRELMQIAIEAGCRVFGVDPERPIAPQVDSILEKTK